MALLRARLREQREAEAAAASRARHLASDTASFGAGWLRSYTLDGRVATSTDARSGVRVEHRGGVRAWSDPQALDDLVLATLRWEVEQEESEGGER